jgi:hypothetical protein
MVKTAYREAAIPYAEETLRKSEDDIYGKQHYEDWVVRELEERLNNGREFTVKTHRGLFHARVGQALRYRPRQKHCGGRLTLLP